MRHTPGPWHVDGDTSASRKLMIYNGTRETSRTPVAYTVPHAEAEANAKLIALAPEMYEALKALVTLCEELAGLGYVHKSSQHPIVWSPDGALANAQAVIQKGENEDAVKQSA